MYENTDERFFTWREINAYFMLQRSNDCEESSQDNKLLVLQHIQQIHIKYIQQWNIKVTITLFECSNVLIRTTRTLVLPKSTIYQQDKQPIYMKIHEI